MEYTNIQAKKYIIVGLISFIVVILLFAEAFAGDARIIYPRFGINAIRHSTDTLTVRFNPIPDSFQIFNGNFIGKWYKTNNTSDILLHLQNYKEGIYSIRYVGQSTVKIERHAIVIKNHNNYNDYLRLIFITDTHLGYRHTTEKLRKWIKIINYENPDIVVFGGDNIEYQNSEYMETFTDLANKINAPLFIISGNHEHHNIFKLPLKDALFKKTIQSFDHYHISLYPLSFYLMDSRNDNLPIPSRCKGPLKSTVYWADTLLASDTMPFKIFVMHGPPRDPSEYNQQNNDLVMNVAKNNGVNFILCGHTHVSAIYDNDMIKHDKIEKKYEPLVVQTGTACKTFMPFAVIREMDFYFETDSLNDKLIYLNEK